MSRNYIQKALTDADEFEIFKSQYNFIENDIKLAQYEELKEAFGGQHIAIAIAIRYIKTLKTETFVKKFYKFAQKIITEYL